AYIAVISCRRNKPFFHRLYHYTSGLVDMYTVIELTLVEAGPHLREKVTEFLLFYIHYTQFAYAGSVYQFTSEREMNHLGKGRRMLALIRPVGDIAGFEIGFRHNSINESRLPYSGMARHQGYLIFEKCFDLIYIGSFGRRHSIARIAYTFVHRLIFFKDFQPFLAKKVQLVEHQNCRYIIRLRRHQKPVDKSQRGWRRSQGHHQDSLIQICSYNLCLLGQVYGFTDDIILARLQGRNHCCVLRGLYLKLHPVAHSDRIGRLYSFYPELSFNTAIIHVLILA